MSIKASIQEYESIKSELKTLMTRSRLLRKKLKNIEGEIANYLESKNQIGVKDEFSKKAIILISKETHSHKKVKEREEDSIRILRDNGIEDAEEVLKKILEARKGEKVVKQTLKVQKIK